MIVQETRDLIAKLAAGLRAVSENGVYETYAEDRGSLLAITDLKSYIPDFILNSPKLDIAYGYMRNHASGSGSWEKRRKYVEEKFKPMLDYLRAVDSSAPTLDEAGIDQISIVAVSAQLTRAKALISSDPASALTKTATALAAVCKHILTEQGQSSSNSDKLPALVSSVARGVLKLDKELDAPSFAAISNQAQLVSEVRNRYGDAHPAPTPDNYLAEFAVATGGALMIFLLKRYEQKMQGLSS